MPFAPMIPRRINGLLRKASQLAQEGRYPEAIDFTIEARDLALCHLGKGHPIFARSLSFLGAYLTEANDLAAAEPLLRQAVELNRAVLGERHVDYANSLCELAILLTKKRAFDAAEPLLQQAVEIAREALGEWHPDLAGVLSDLARLYQAKGDKRSAEPLFRQALDIRTTVRSSPSTTREWQREFAIALTDLGNLYCEMGDLVASESLIRQAAGVFLAINGKRHPEFATSLVYLAQVSQAKNDLASAISLLRWAIDIYKAAYGERDRTYADCLNQLAALYRDAGHCADAELLCQQVLEIRRAVFGEHSSAVGSSLNSLAILYSTMGKYAAAEPLYRQSMEILRAARGERHPAYAMSLNNLARHYLDTGEFESAQPLFRQAMEVDRVALGGRNPAFAKSLMNLADYYQQIGDPAAAEPLLRQALEIARAALGARHPIIPELLVKLADSQAASDRPAQALNLMVQAAVIEDRVIGQFLSSGFESQRIAFLSRTRSNMCRIISLALGDHEARRAATKTAFDLVLRRKAVLAETLAMQRDVVSRAISTGRNPELASRVRELAALRSRIAQETLAGPGSEGIERHRQLLDHLEAERQQIETELAPVIPAMILAQDLRFSDSRSVVLSLPSDVALVEFVRFYPRDFRAVHSIAEPAWKPARYVTFVVHAGAPDDIHLVDLGEADPIDRLIADYRDGILAGPEGRSSRDMTNTRVGPAQAPAADVSSALRAAVFDVLAPYLGGRAKLLLAPDGDLARLPFESLPCGDGRWLIDDYRISYLSCGRDVLRFGVASPCRPGKPLVIADPDFDLKATGWRLCFMDWMWPRRLRHDNAATGAKLTKILPRDLATPTPGRRSRDLGRQAYHFEHLPGTRAEGEAVSRLLGVRARTGAAALEGRLKADCRSPRILHLATHGFFLPDQPHGNARESLGLMHDPAGLSDRLSGSPPENPMLRSGLALAGANTWLESGTPPPKAEDGLLTAEDVTSLDLLATELVVLSACETGLGQIHVGEGVFGLRRAFVLAGAKTLVMSLWKVPDEPTRELMENFYHRLLAGEGRAEALHQAQLTLKAKYPDPFYWGAFICQGDPSPLGTAGPGATSPGISNDRLPG